MNCFCVSSEPHKYLHTNLALNEPINGGSSTRVIKILWENYSKVMNSWSEKMSVEVGRTKCCGTSGEAFSTLKRLGNNIFLMCCRVYEGSKREASIRLESLSEVSVCEKLDKRSVLAEMLHLMLRHHPRYTHGAPIWPPPRVSCHVPHYLLYATVVWRMYVPFEIWMTPKLVQYFCPHPSAGQTCFCQKQLG